MKLRTYISAIALAALAIPAAAQNLDPTVNVTRAYEGKLLEVDKPVMKMAVPDSVTRFNLDFDYSVLESPYKGAEDFTPYLQDIRPEKALANPARFWLRLGAGYTLHPELDFVWSAFNKDHFKMNVYGTHRSYYGKYHGIYLDADNNLKAPKLFTEESKARLWKGYDIYSKAGLNGRVDWSEGSFFFDANYEGIAVMDSLATRPYNSVNLVARAQSNVSGEDYFFYDAGLKYTFANHGLKDGVLAEPTFFREHLFSMDGSLGPAFNYYHSVLVDVNMDIASYTFDGGKVLTSAGKFALTPKYRFVKDRWNIEAGVKFEALLHPKDYTNNQVRGQVAYPKVNVNFAVMEDYLNLYLRADGGADINDYSSLVRRNHWFVPFGEYNFENTVERANVALGLNGNIMHVSDFNFRVGYANYANYAMDMFRSYFFGARYDDNFSFQMAYAALDFGVKTESVDVEGSIAWKYSYFGSKVADEARIGFLPSPLSGDVKVTYNWKRRIFAGVSVDAALGRKGCLPDVAGEVKIPGYVDLGIDAEYRFMPKMSVWAKAQNLACMQIQKTPYYAEFGPYFTVGICLNL